MILFSTRECLFIGMKYRWLFPLIVCRRGLNDFFFREWNLFLEEVLMIIVRRLIPFVALFSVFLFKDRLESTLVAYLFFCLNICLFCRTFDCLLGWRIIELRVYETASVFLFFLWIILLSGMLCCGISVCISLNRTWIVVSTSQSTFFP